MQATRIILIRPFSKDSSFNRERNNLKSELSIDIARIRGILDGLTAESVEKVTLETGEAANIGNCIITKSTIEKTILFIVLKFFLQISANGIKEKEGFIL